MRTFAAAIQAEIAAGHFALIAEIKKASQLVQRVGELGSRHLGPREIGAEVRAACRSSTSPACGK